MHHIRLVHANTDGFLLQCNLQGCRRTFRNFGSYRNHVYTYHDADTIMQDTNALDDVNGACGDGGDVGTSDGDGNDDDAAIVYSSELQTIGNHDHPKDEELKRAAAVWLLKTRKLHRIPLSVMDAIILDLQASFHQAFMHIQTCVKLKLRKAAVPESIIQDVSRELSETNAAADIFRGLKTQKQQHTFFVKELKLVVSLVYCSCISLNKSVI